MKLRPLKIYTIDGYGKAFVPNYEHFDNMDDAYSKLFLKLVEIIEKVVPAENGWIKSSSQKRLESVISEKFAIRDKTFEAYKKKRHVKQRGIISKILLQERKNFFESKLSECVGRPKNL